MILIFELTIKMNFKYLLNFSDDNSDNKIMLNTGLNVIIICCGNAEVSSMLSLCTTDQIGC